MKTYLNYLPFRLATVLCASGLFLTLAQPGAMAAEPAAPELPKKWESVASLGATLTRGNSENFLANATINSSRKWARDEMLLGASGGYGSTTVKEEGAADETNKTDEYLKGFAQWNHLFTQRFYGGLRFDALYDDIADIDYRFTLSPLAGYYFIKQTNTFLSGELGPSFVYEKQGGETDFYVGARVA